MSTSVLSLHWRREKAGSAMASRSLNVLKTSQHLSPYRVESGRWISLFIVEKMEKGLNGGTGFEGRQKGRRLVLRSREEECRENSFYLFDIKK